MDDDEVNQVYDQIQQNLTDQEVDAALERMLVRHAAMCFELTLAKLEQ